MNQELPKPLREALARQSSGDGHPSPDALTAFLEHSLPHRESQAITNHLANCADCREVIFLASNAVEEPVGEEQELMPDTAVPRISPALLAKAEGAQAISGRAPADLAPRRIPLLRWSWIPVVAAALLVATFLVRRYEFAPAPQSPMIIASEGQPAASNTQEPPTTVPEPGPETHLALRESLGKSAHKQSSQVRSPDIVASSPVASKGAGQYPSAPMVKATPNPLSPPQDAIAEAYKPAPAALPHQNSFVESDAQNASGLVARSQPVLEKPRMAMLPAVVARRQWRVTSDGHLEHSISSGNWTRVLADQPAQFHVVSVVGDNVWAGGNDGVLFHSSDGGQNWVKAMLSSPPSVETGTIVSIQFNDAMHGVVTTADGSQWNTSDGGVTWTKE